MRSTLISSALLVSFAALACSDSPPTPSNPRPLPPTEFALSGHVSDVNTGAPLSGATIAIIDGANVGRATTSGADGTYVLAMGPGGFTMRVRSDGYDSVFQGVTFVADTRVDIQMRRVMQSLAGTWTGTLSFVQVNTGIGTDAAIPALVMTHAGSAISSAFRTSGPYQRQLRRYAPRSRIDRGDDRHRRHDDDHLRSRRQGAPDLPRHGQLHREHQLDACGDDGSADVARLRHRLERRHNRDRPSAVRRYCGHPLCGSPLTTRSAFL